MTYTHPSPSSMAAAGAPKSLPISTTWVPLDDYIHQWTCLDESYRTDMVLSTISSALNAFTLEMRALFKGVLAEQLGIDRRALDEAMFPESGDVAPVRELVA